MRFLLMKFLIEKLLVKHYVLYVEEFSQRILHNKAKRMNFNPVHVKLYLIFFNDISKMNIGIFLPF